MLNADDKHLSERIKNYSKIVAYSYKSGDYVRIIEFFNELFVKLVVEIQRENHLIEANLVGKYNYSNILAAITAGLVCGVYGR